MQSCTLLSTALITNMTGVYMLANQNDSAKPKQSEQLLNLISDFEYFHDQHNTAYVSCKIDGHIEIWQVKSHSFKSLLARKYWNFYSKPISNQAIKEALLVLEAKAFYEGKQHHVFLRVANYNNNIYIDLCNKSWQVLEITSKGWNILNKSPVKFRRTESMRPLPMPIQKIGNIELLWNNVNIPSKSRILVLAWILECLRSDTPFTILVLTGLQGSAKSFTQNILRNLIDPNIVNLRSSPRKFDDLSTDAANNWLVSYNNISHLKDDSQDDFCCMSTGGGFSHRSLFTDMKECVFDIKRPTIMNGIFGFITRPDLLDRSIVIELPRISETNRKTEIELQALFEKNWQLIFSGILDLLVKVLKHIPYIKINKLPRMADFAILGTALEKALDEKPGIFLSTYQANFTATIENTIESSPRHQCIN
jgi:hypothetical protein